MDKLNILLIVIGFYFLFKFVENFKNFSELTGFNNQWGNYDDANLKNYKATKTSDLITNCDEKREHCIHY